jgi:voltage-gated potassium channel
MRGGINAYVDRHEVAWELSFAALAVVFVAIGFLQPATPADETRLVAAEWAITLVFAGEFFGRLWASYDRSGYVRGHWIDLVSVVPPARGLRPLRLLRLLRLVRAFAGVSRAMAHMPRLAQHRGLVWLVAAWAAVTVLASIGLYIAENGTNQAIANPFDAIWWGVVTLTTVGYGDVYPVTPEGRMAAMVLMLLGIGLYSAITAAVTSYFITLEGQSRSPLAELERANALREAGALTDHEYAAIKRRLLGTDAQGAQE